MLLQIHFIHLFCHLSRRPGRQWCSTDSLGCFLLSLKFGLLSCWERWRAGSGE